MAPRYTYENALSYTFAQLAEMHNQTFAGYFFPIAMTAETTAEFWRIYSIDAVRTVIMRESGELAGVARLGVRGDRGWCGGFGIAPERRGTGAADRLAEQMVSTAREAGMKSLQLEVLTQNVKAIRVYEKAGFSTRRKVTLFTFPVASLRQAAHGVSPTAETASASAVLAACLAQDPPVWQREAASILTQANHGSQLTSGTGGASLLLAQRIADSLSIVAAALDPATTPAELARWWLGMAGDATQVRVFNEPEGSPLHRLCTRLEGQIIAEQLEMVLPL
jgi:ribosomal protein S18 acetylase RimI-like enzyme